MWRSETLEKSAFGTNLCGPSDTRWCTVWLASHASHSRTPASHVRCDGDSPMFSISDRKDTNPKTCQSSHVVFGQHVTAKIEQQQLVRKGRHIASHGVTSVTCDGA